MEVTFIFPSTSVSAKAAEGEVQKLKSNAFSLWKKLVHKKYGPDESVDDILPSDSTPISLGQLCLATYLKERGIRVNYIHSDYYLKGKGYTEEEFMKFLIDATASSQFVGIYAMTPMINSALGILEHIKNNNPEIITVLGGPHATYMDQEVISNYPFVDIVSRGEGEQVLFSLINNYDGSDEYLHKIDGITYKKGAQVIRNKDQELLCAAEIPDPDYELVQTDFNFLCTVMYSRGCPYSCKFCAEGNLWRHVVRFRDPVQVAKEIDLIYRRFGQRVIHIADSEIDAVPKKLEKLLDEIIALDISCRFTVNLRCDAYKRLTPELISKMKRAGFFGYLIGVESASDKMLEIMGRNSVFEDFLRTIDLLNDNDAGYILPGIMMGFPGETLETFEYTKQVFLDLLKNERVDYFFPKLFVPYPGSDPFMNPEKYGIEVSHCWNEYSRFDTRQIFESKHISAEYISNGMLDFYRIINDTYKGLLEKYENKAI